MGSFRAVMEDFRRFRASKIRECVLAELAKQEYTRGSSKQKTEDGVNAHFCALLSVF